MIEEVGTTGEGDLLESASKTAKVLVGHLNDVEAISLEGRKQEIRNLRKSFLEYEPLAMELARLAISSEQQRGGGLAGLNSEKISALSSRVAELRNSLDSGLDLLVTSRRLAFETTLDTTVALLQTRATQAGVVAALSLVGVMLMLLSLSRGIVSPIRTLSEITRKVAQGNFEAGRSIDPIGNDEVAQLAQASRRWRRASIPPPSPRATWTTSSGT
jgi:HAMP domain-containing protein